MELHSGPFSSSAWKEQIHVIADVLEMSQNRLICTESRNNPLVINNPNVVFVVNCPIAEQTVVCRSDSMAFRSGI